MTVWVDDMHKYPMGRFGRMKMSHMMADTDEELHAMAAKIGVARKWHQHKGRWSDSHYDIALSKRALAVAEGAVEITLREMSAYNWHRRAFGFAVDPKVASEKMAVAARASAKSRQEAGHA